MLTYQPKNLVNEARREYPWALLLMAFAWLWPGVFAHDLWNPGEPQLFTVIEQFAQQRTWQPMLFEQPFFEVAPVYIWAAAAWRALFSPWAMDAYAAARLTSVMFAAIGLIGCGMAGYRLLGRHQGRIVVLILLGSLGLLPITHLLSGFSVVFAAVGLIFWAFSIARQQLWFACMLCAIGLALLFQAGGFIMPLAVWLVGGLLWRNRAWHAVRFGVFLVGGALTALPLAAFYPLLLRLSEPEIFQLYWHNATLGYFGGFGAWNIGFSLPYYFTQTLWFAFPAWPLALWTLSRRKVSRHAYRAFALTWLMVFGAILTMLPEKHQDWLVLILPALALLGAGQLDALRSGAARFLNWFGLMTFGCAMLFFWVGFIAMNAGFPRKLAERAEYFSPHYVRDWDGLAMGVAIIFCAGWVFAIKRRRIRGRQAVTNWAAGTTLVWALLMTLFLPWVDAAKSHRPVVQNMQQMLPEDVRQNVVCVAVSPHDLVTRMVWRQYGALDLRVDGRCDYVLKRVDSTFRLPEGANLVWQGHRPRNKNEIFVLYRQ